MNNPSPRRQPKVGAIRRIGLFEVHVALNDVARLLGNKNSKKPSDKLTKQIQEMEPIAANCCRPLAVYGFWKPQDLAKLNIPQDFSTQADLIALGLVTIGSSLENESKRLFNAKLSAKATIADAFGSGLAESTACVLDQMISDDAAILGMETGSRISPGYGQWKLDAQKPLLSLLKGHDIGIELKESMIMTPRKSISFAKAVGKKISGANSANPCILCDNILCHIRRCPDSIN